MLTVPDPDPQPGLAPAAAWGDWTGLAADLLVDTVRGGRRWASTSAALLALSASGLRYDFTADPGDADSWASVHPAARPDPAVVGQAPR